MALPVPILILPPIIMRTVFRNVASKSLKMIAELSVITVCLGFAIPMSVALFPQQSTIPASKLEPQFQNLIDKNGHKITTFTYNKGL